MWTPSYKECEDKNFFDGARDTCGSSNVTIILNLDGKKVGEIGAFVEKNGNLNQQKFLNSNFMISPKLNSF